MLEALAIFAVGLIPALFSIGLVRHNQRRTRAKLRQAAIAARTVSGRSRQSALPPIPERYYLEGVGYLIGDISCRFNARSGYLRCAVNPQGLCQGCPYYEEVGSREKLES